MSNKGLSSLWGEVVDSDDDDDGGSGKKLRVSGSVGHEKPNKLYSAMHISHPSPAQPHPIITDRPLIGFDRLFARFVLPVVMVCPLP